MSSVRALGRKSSPYTAGEINKLIDDLIHPLAKKDKSFVILDGFLHAFSEKNPPQSLRKFIKCSLPEIIRGIEKESRDQA